MHRWCAPDEYKIHQRHFTYTCSLVLTACSGYKDKFCLLKKTVHCDPSHFWLVFFHSFSTLEHPIPLLLFPLEILHWREMPLQKYIKKNEYRLFSRVISIKSANRMRQNSEISVSKITHYPLHTGLYGELDVLCCCSNVLVVIIMPYVLDSKYYIPSNIMLERKKWPGRCAKVFFLHLTNELIIPNTVRCLCLTLSVMTSFYQKLD